METLKRIAAQIAMALRGMQWSQRAAIILCAAIVAVSVLWMVQWSGKRVYEPLTSRTLTEEELTVVRAKLEEWRIEHRMDGERIMVPPNMRHDVSARLIEAEIVPASLTLGFDALMSDESPWLSESEKERRWNLALSNELASTLSRMAGVRKARVFIDNRHKRRFGSPSVQPSAVVSIWPGPGFEFDRKRIHMFASFVSGAVAGLDIGRVRVIDESQGRSYTAHDPDANMAGDLLAIRRSEEEHFISKIRDRLSYIPGVLVQVFAEQETEQFELQSTTLDKPVVSKSSSETSDVQRRAASTGPGVAPNTSVALRGGGTDERSVTESTDEEFNGERGREVKQVTGTKGVIKSMTATIGVPRSWLVGTFKRLKGGDGEPSDPDLAQFEQSEFLKITEAVSKIINAADDDTRVAVSSFPDDVLVVMSAATGSTEGPTIASYATRYGPQAGLAALALLSLGMMLRVVRKTPTGPTIPRHLLDANEREMDDDLPHRSRIISETAQPLGDALSIDSMLEGHELDSHAVRTQQIAKQVADLVDKNPENVSELLRRWITQSR